MFDFLLDLLEMLLGGLSGVPSVDVAEATYAVEDFAELHGRSIVDVE
jgi:hypothetical protein